jgi:hypothetical protein
MNQNAANSRILLPSERVKLFSATEWEGFVLEWVEILRSSYGLGGTLLKRINVREFDRFEVRE